MEHDELELLDREERVFSVFQTAIDLINPESERNPNKVEELLSFLAEEYDHTRELLRQVVAHKNPEAAHQPHARQKRNSAI